MKAWPGRSFRTPSPLTTVSTGGCCGVGQPEVQCGVLGWPEPITSPDQMDVKKYGVIVSCGSHRGLLLPDLDGVDTVEQ